MKYKPEHAAYFTKELQQSIDNGDPAVMVVSRGEGAARSLHVVSVIPADLTKMMLILAATTLSEENRVA